MPEAPDFQKLARRISDAAGLSGDGAVTSEMIEQLRLVWNARGAADIATIETSLASQMGATASGPYVKNLDRDLRKLDR